MNVLPASAVAALAEGHAGGSRWILQGTGEDSPLSCADARTLLDAGECARADRFVFARDRERWVRSRAWLRLALGEWLGREPGDLRFSLGEYGRPFLTDFPEAWFNLSHTGDYVAVLLAAAPGQGIDMEQIDPDFPHLDVAAGVFPPEDVTALAASDFPAEYFTRLWTARESVMKACGLGMNLEPGSIALHWHTERHATATVPGDVRYAVQAGEVLPGLMRATAAEVPA